MNIRTANGKLIQTRGEVKLPIKPEAYVTSVTFVVSDELTVHSKLGTAFSDKHIHSIE